MSAKITSTKGSITRRVSAQAGSNFCAEFHFRREMFTLEGKKPQGTKTQYMNVDPRVSLLPLHAHAEFHTFPYPISRASLVHFRSAPNNDLRLASGKGI